MIFTAKKHANKPQKNPQKTLSKQAPKPAKKAIFYKLASDPKRKQGQQAQNSVTNPKNAYFIERRNIYTRHKKKRLL